MTYYCKYKPHCETYTEHNGQCLVCEVLYAAGLTEPNYPVPTVRDCNGIVDDWCMIGATYVDWSRGKLEIY